MVILLRDINSCCYQIGYWRKWSGNENEWPFDETSRTRWIHVTTQLCSFSVQGATSDEPHPLKPRTFFERAAHEGSSWTPRSSTNLEEVAGSCLQDWERLFRA